MSMSTPINQIRNMSASPVGTLPPELMPQVQSMPINNSLMSPVYNPNIPPMDNSHQSNQTSSQLVDDILNEMERSTVPGDRNMMDMNVGNINYTMDASAHVPPQRNPNAMNQILSGGEQTKSPSMMAFSNINLDTHNLDIAEPMSKKIIKEVKPVAIVFIVVFLLSLHQFNRLLFGFFPSLILENGELSLYAILLRAFIASVVFYVANKFIPV